MQKAKEAGVDAVITSGTEGGGHSGFDQLTTFCLVPMAVDAVDIPVVAGGGVVDARGLLAAIALGAVGVYMGTRFMVTVECPAHQNVKRAILDARDTSTIAVRHGSPVLSGSVPAGDRGFVEERRGSVRVLLNTHINRLLRESGGNLAFDDTIATPNGSDPSFESNQTVACYVLGDVENTPVTISQASGLIQDIPTCRELIERIISESKPILEKLRRIQ
jgi:NAD(P)H-dependent flavin oxidoreductase YrpB (nitropropane dioxygenase family)